MPRDRRTVAYVQRRHGAWLIHLTGEVPLDRPDDENYDVASSLAVAKRLAKEGASVYATNLRWVEDPDIGGWRLDGVEKEWAGD